jgi:hypothetical protein
VHFALADILKTQARGDWIASHGGISPPPPGIVDGLVGHWQPKLTTRLILWVLNHRLLPEAFLVGLLHLSGLSETRLQFLAGSFSYGGWWYYFPLVMLRKTSLATLTGFGLAAIYFITSRRPVEKRDPWSIAPVILAPVIYLVIAIVSHVNVGIRHLLPIYPFLYLLLGIAAAQSIRHFPRFTAVILLLLTMGLATESACAFPDFIPFLNVAAGGWRHGVELLGDSNIDWGEDLPALAHWQRQNPDRQLYLCYFGTADARYYGIHYLNLSGSMAQPDQDQSSGLPVVIAISAAMMRNPLLPVPQQRLFHYLQTRPPQVVLGHTIYLYAYP